MTTLSRGLALVRRVRLALYGGGVLAILTIAYPGGLGAAYSNAEEIRALHAEMDDLHKQRVRMDQECVLVTNRIAVKEALVEDMIAGRRTLKDVAGEFARMIAEDPIQLHVLEAAYAETSDLEFHARVVLGYAELRCGSGSTHDRIMSDLRRQYREIQAEQEG